MFPKNILAVMAAALLLSVAAPAAAQPLTPLQAAGFFAVWSAPGSTGVTDDPVNYTGILAGLPQNAAAGVVTILRYLVSLPPTQEINFACTRLGAIVRDGGTGGRVIVRLRQTFLFPGGASITPLSIDTANYPNTNNFEVREATMSGSPFSFNANVYHIEVELRRDAAGAFPSVAALYIGAPLSSTFCP
jgi:hypothetical protein